MPSSDANRRRAQLAGLGYRHFTAVAGPEGLTTSDIRLAGFQRGLSGAGLGPAEVHRVSFNCGSDADELTGLAGQPT